jgi:uncharacterized protein YbjT (DUF2867 family)
MTKPLKVLVAGATGKQGGAVARQLIARGHQVRAFTRDLDKPAAKAIAQLGVELARGNLEDRPSIDRALQGMDALFSVGTPFEEGTQAEARHGILAADAAIDAGVQLVYSSVANADQQTGIPHFESKLVVEKHIRSRGSDATIIAPAYFMENVDFIRQQLRDGVYPSPLSPGRALAQVAVSDIGAVAVAVLEDRARHAGKRYDLAGDELTGAESVEILSRVTGRPISYLQLPMDAVRARMGDDGAAMYQWFESPGYTVDRPALRATFPGTPWLTFEAWAEAQDWTWLTAG